MATQIETDLKISDFRSKLKAEYQALNDALKKQGEKIDATKNPNTRMILLRTQIDSAFTSAMGLSKLVMSYIGVPLVRTEMLEKSNENSYKERLRMAAKIKNLESKNSYLKKELATIIEEMKSMKQRISWLESRPPGGGSPPPARAQIRQTKY